MPLSLRPDARPRTARLPRSPGRAPRVATQPSLNAATSDVSPLNAGPSGPHSSNVTFSLLPDNRHRRAADEIQWWVNRIQASRGEAVEDAFDQALRIRRAGKPVLFAALSAMQLGAQTHAATVQAAGRCATAGVATHPAHGVAPSFAPRFRTQRAASNATGIFSNRTPGVLEATEARSNNTLAALDVLNASTIATWPALSCDVSGNETAPALSGSESASRDVRGNFTTTLCALERSLRSVASGTRMASGERAATLAALHALAANSTDGGFPVAEVAHAFTRVLNERGSPLTAPVHALESTTIQRMQCVHALEWLIDGRTHGDPWHIAGESLIDAAAAGMRLPELRDRMVRRVGNLTRVNMPAARWAVTTILAERQASLLCADAPANMTYGSLEWADLEIGCQVARVFDADPASLNYTTLAGLAVALDQEIRTGALDASWFELGADASVMFAAQLNASDVRARLEQPLIDVHSLHNFTLRELDRHRLDRWKRVNATIVHLEAYSSALKAPVPQRSALAAEALHDRGLDPEEVVTTSSWTLLDDLLAGPPYASTKLRKDGATTMVEDTHPGQTDARWLPIPDIDQTFSGAFSQWIGNLQRTLCDVAHDALNALRLADPALDGAVDEVRVLDIHVRRSAGEPMSTFELIGHSTQIKYESGRRAYDAAVRDRLPGSFYPARPDTTIVCMRRGRFHQYYLLDLLSPRGPAVEAIGAKSEALPGLLEAMRVRLFPSEALTETSRGGRSREYQIKVREKFSRLGRCPGAAVKSSVPVCAASPIDWAAVACGLAGAAADKMAGMVRMQAYGPVERSAALPTQRTESIGSTLVKMFVPFAACVDSTRRGEVISAIFSCGTDAVGALFVAGVAVRSAAELGTLASRHVFAAMLTRSLPAAHQRYVLGGLASAYLHHLRDTAARATPHLLREAFNVVDPGFSAAWRLISASARQAPRALESLRSRMKATTELEGFRSTPEPLRSLYAKASPEPIKPLAAGETPELAPSAANARPLGVAKPGDRARVMIDGTSFAVASGEDVARVAGSVLESPAGLPAVYRLPVEYDPQLRAWRVDERLLGSDANPDRARAPAHAISPGALRLQVLAEMQILLHSADETAFSWGYAREIDLRLPELDLESESLDTLRGRFLDASRTPMERGQILRLIENRELAELSARCRDEMFRMWADPLVRSQFEEGCLAYRDVLIRGWMRDLRLIDLHVLFLAEHHSPYQRGALWARMLEASQIELALNTFEQMRFWRTAVDDGAARPAEFLIDELSREDSYEACLRLLGQGLLSPGRLGAVRARTVAHRAAIDVEYARFNMLIQRAVRDDTLNFQRAYDAEFTRARLGDHSILAALYEHTHWPSLTAGQIGTLAGRIDRARERCAALETAADAMLRQRMETAEALFRSIDPDSLTHDWLADVPGVGADLDQAQLARRFVASVHAADITVEQRARIYERFIVTRNFDRISRTIERMSRDVNRVRYEQGYGEPVQTLRDAGFDPERLRTRGGVRAFERALSEAHDPETYGAFQAILEQRAGEEGTLQLRIARHNVVSTPRARDYLTGYIRRVPVPGIERETSEAYSALFRSGLLSDTQLGSLAARIDEQRQQRLMQGAGDGIALFERIFAASSRPTSVRYVPSMILPPMLDGVLGGPCWPMSMITALALAQGVDRLDDWLARLTRLAGILNRAREVAQQRGTAAGVVQTAMVPTEQEIEYVAETVSVLSRLTLTQPDLHDALEHGELIDEPSVRAADWVDSILVAPPGVRIVGTPHHAMVVATELPAGLPRYAWFEPNYGLIGYQDATQFRAFMESAIHLEYGDDEVFQFWRIDATRLGAMRIPRDPADAGTLSDFIAGTQKAPEPAPLVDEVAAEVPIG